MSEPKRVEVGGCYDCLWARDATWCLHPFFVGDFSPAPASFFGEEPAPPGCPLRKGPVLVVLRGVE